MIRVKESVRVPSQLSSSIIGPFACQGGDILYSLYDMNDPLKVPIGRISPRGELKAQYRISDAGADLQGGDFFVSSEGDVYQAAWRAGTWDEWIVSYGKDGTYKSKTKIDEKISPHAFAVFSSGSFILTGLEEEGPPGDRTKTLAFTGLYDSSGKLLRRIKLPNDKLIADGVSKRDTDFTGTATITNIPVVNGRVVSGSDGNVYIMRRTKPATIYGISPSGEVVKTIRLEADPKLPEPFFLQAREGGLVVGFQSSGVRSPTLIKVVDFDGNVMSTFDVDPSLGAAFTCFESPNKATFLTMRDRALTIVEADSD